MPLDSFTVELRFKALGDLSTGVLMSADGQLMLAFNETLGIFATFETSQGQAVVSALGAHHDAWHHLAITYGADSITMFLDGKVASSVPKAAPLKASPSYATFGARLSSNKVDESTSFHGHLDEIKIWNRTLTSEGVTDLYNSGGDIGEGRLLIYHNFNHGVDVPTLSAAYDASGNGMDAFFGSLNEDGVSSGVSAEFPTYVVSTDSFGNSFATVKDVPVDMTLQGGTTCESPPCGVTFILSTLPLYGKIYDNGKAVYSSPSGLSGPSVTYVPDADYNGVDVFKYQVTNGDKVSAKKGVAVSIAAVNDIPACVSSSITVTTTGNDTYISLDYVDADDDFTSVRITRIPSVGTLYRVSDAGSMGDQILASGAEISSLSTMVVFSPSDLSSGSQPGEVYDDFGYEVSDHEGTSQECGVQIVLDENACDIKPIAGESGYALFFTGLNEVAYLGSMSSYASQDLPFSVGLYFRTSDSTLSTSVTLISAGPFDVMWNKLELLLSVGGSSIHTGKSFTDRHWHHVVFTYESGVTALYVDGIAYGTVTVNVNVAEPDSLRLGLTSGSKSGFNGEVDEVAISNVADVSQDSSTHVAHWQFNEGSGSDLYFGRGGRYDPRYYGGSLGDSGIQSTQPKWVASTLSTANELTMQGIAPSPYELVCSSSHTLDLEAVILALPTTGKLFYTDDGTSKSYEITAVPTLVSKLNVLYEPSSIDCASYAGRGSTDAFAYACVGDLIKSMHGILGSSFYGTTSASMNQFLNTTNLQQKLDSVPEPDTSASTAQFVEGSMPELVTESLFYDLSTVASPPNTPPFEVQYEDPLIPLTPSAPAVRQVAQDALELLVSTMYPDLSKGVTGTANVQIASVKFEVKFDKTSFADTSGSVKAEFLQEFVMEVARESNVMEDSVEVLSYTAFPFTAKAKVSFMAGGLDAQKNAVSLTKKLQEEPITMFTESFSVNYGYASLSDISSDTITPSTLSQADRSCVQLSDIQVVTVDVQSVNHYPVGCTGNNCTFTFELGATDPIMVNLPASDDDCDELQIILSQLPEHGTIHTDVDTYFNNTVPKKGVVVEGPPFVLYYQPEANQENNDGFSYVISDGKVLSHENTVTFIVDATGISTTGIVTGNAGYSLYFDGVDDVLTVTNAQIDVSKDFTVSFWLRTSSKMLDGMAIFAVGPCELKWSKIKGLEFSIGNVTASLYSSLNDGEWHFIVASSTSGTGLSLSSDGAYSTDALATYIPAISSNSALTFGVGGEGSKTSFHGYIDELAIFSSSSVASGLNKVFYEDHCSSYTLQCLSGSEENLLGYYRFNEGMGGVAKDSSTLKVDAILGIDGKANTAPQWTNSFVPLNNTIDVLEGSESVISLYNPGEISNPASITFPVLPTHGELRVGGSRVKTTSKIKSDSLITYIPKASYFGSDTFSYAADDVIEGLPTKVFVTVHPVIQAPTAKTGSVYVDYQNPSAVKIPLDVSKSHSLSILNVGLTYLPSHGTIYHDQGLTHLAEVGDSLSGSYVVYYLPFLNSQPEYDRFGFFVEDIASEDELYLGNEASLIRAMRNESTATQSSVVIYPENAYLMNSDTPISSQAGLCLSFESSEQYMSLGQISSYTAKGELTGISFYLRTDVVVESEVKIMSIGSITLVLSKLRGLTLCSGGSCVYSRKALNDKAWTYVKCTFLPHEIQLQVDSDEPLVKTLAQTTSLSSSSEIIFGSSAGSAFFQGEVDELHITSNDTNLAYFRFNEVSGDKLLDSVSGLEKGELGSGGAYQPARVTSSCPVVRHQVSLLQKSEKVIELAALSTEPSVSKLIYTITKLPAKGSLKQASGKEITSTPFKLGSSTASQTSTVIFSADYSSGSTEIRYVVDAEGDGILSVQSAESVVDVTILEETEVELVSSELTFSMEENNILDIDLTSVISTSEAQNTLTPFEYSVTSLPEVGHLYTDEKDGISVVSTLIPNGKVTFVPAANAIGTFYFGVQISRGLSVSPEIAVTINVSGNRAIELHEGSTITAVGNDTSLQNDFTVQAWVKASDLESTIYQLVTTAHTTLQYDLARAHEKIETPVAWPVSLTKVSNYTFDISRWNHVSFVASGTKKALFIDGVLVGLAANFQRVRQL